MKIFVYPNNYRNVSIKTTPIKSNDESTRISTLGGSYIYYVTKVDYRRISDKVTLFGDDEFNTLSKPIDVENVVSSAPAAPDAGDWYLMSASANSNAGALMYYTGSRWQYMNPFEGLKININGFVYEFKDEGEDDNRWEMAEASTQLAASGAGASSVVYDLGDTTAGESTVSVSCEGYDFITYQYTISGVDTDVVVRGEGSVDNTSWFNFDSTEQDVTYTSDGTYAMTIDAKFKYTRFVFVSETATDTGSITSVKLYMS